MLKICVGCIPNFISFDSNGGISCNVSRFSYFKSVNFLEIYFHHHHLITHPPHS